MRVKLLYPTRLKLLPNNGIHALLFPKEGFLLPLKMRKALNIARWIIGVLFILLAALWWLSEHHGTQDFLFGLLILFIGSLLIPPIFRFFKKYSWVFLIIVVLLIFLNPSPSEFRNSIRTPTDPKSTVYKRTSNCIIFSFYLEEWPDRADDGTEFTNSAAYLGIAGNFFEWH